MTVYEPKEDSYLLANFISDLDIEGKKALDMGTGSGILAIQMSEQGAEVTAADLNPEAIQNLEEEIEKQDLDIRLVESDLFENIDQKYDLIVFNPPYLPGKDNQKVGDEEIWRGGEKGTEITERFLEKADDYLTSDGEVYVILSSLANFEPLVEKFDLEIVEKEELWFETLFIARYR